MRRRFAIAVLCLLVAGPVLAQTQDGTATLTNQGLHVAEAAFGTGVTDRMLDGASYSFPVGTRVYCWTRLLDGAPGDTVLHVWLHDGVEIQRVELPVSDQHWRTWSYKTLYPGMGGQWTVEVRSAGGQVLGSYDFTATE